ncbi:MAG TPA: prepilin-type N-terminal cleavage/methylation domain-containing protein [Gemmata sp.]|nr:prepilin-type N-terminal cleavage/methylation domain-containing protein [Gemmata sp.]
MSNPQHHRGYTLIELLIVMAILILFVTLVLPSTSSYWSGNRQKAAADQIRGEIAAARAWAIEEGVPYRVALSSDGTKVRRAPESEFSEPAADNGPASARRVEQTFDSATAQLISGGDASSAASGNDGWLTIAVIMPDGTCRDDRMSTGDNGNQIVTVAVQEQPPAGQPAGNGIVYVILRGITGDVRISNTPPGQSP